jgi:subtilisin family serine protease
MKASESVNAIVRRRLEYKLFKGVSIQLNNETDIETAVSNIEDMTKVKNVWPVRTIQMPNNTVIWTGNDFNAAGSALNNRQSTNTINNPLPHVMTQVDRLHAKGVTGKGAKIAVLDSGIDYMVSIPYADWIFPMH